MSEKFASDSDIKAFFDSPAGDVFRALFRAVYFNDFPLLVDEAGTIVQSQPILRLSEQQSGITMPPRA